MVERDYVVALENAVKRLEELGSQEEEIELEKNKLRQFIHATLNLLPDKTAKTFRERLLAVLAEKISESYGLTDAIRSTLQHHYPNWLTVTEVRNGLVERGFDFSSYRSNPLAAVSTTLRRLSEDETENVEKTEIDGVKAYRTPKPKPVKGIGGPTVSLGKAMQPRKTFGQRIGEPEK